MANLKRLRLCRDYWLQIPPERVIRNLAFYRNGEMPAVGLDNLTACRTNACLAGWLWSMPEFVDFVRDNIFVTTYDLTTEALQAWLELTGEERFKLFSCRPIDSVRDGSDWEVALGRLDRLIAREEARAREGR